MVSNRRVIVCAIAVVFASCGRDTQTGSAPRPATVTAPVKEAALTSITLTADAERRLGLVTLAVERKTVARTRTVGAEIAAPSGAAVVMTAPVAGILQSPSTIPLAGSEVTRGQLLFRLVPIQPADRDAAVDARQAADTALARRLVAEQRTRRAEQLVKDGSGSRRALEEAQAELTIADAEARAAQDRVSLAVTSGASGSGIAIEAPADATVQAVHARDGQTVAAGVPVIDLVRLVTMWLRVPVYAGEADAIDRTAAARVLALSDAVDTAGIVARPMPSPPAANPSTASVDLFYVIDNSRQRLRPGERVLARLPLKGTAESLVVPKAALLHDAFGGTWVYVQREPHVYARQRVAVIDIVDSSALLQQGPAPGARVVTDGAAELFGVEFGAGK